MGGGYGDGTAEENRVVEVGDRVGDLRLLFFLSFDPAMGDGAGLESLRSDRVLDSRMKGREAHLMKEVAGTTLPATLAPPANTPFANIVPACPPPSGIKGGCNMKLGVTPRLP